MNRITRYIEGRRIRKNLREMKLKYNLECNDLACFKSALPRAIRHGNDTLSIQLRTAIMNSQAECSKLKTRIELMEAGINRLKANNVIGTTG